MVVAWPTVLLNEEQEALCSHLLERMGYLGRAESWACAHIAKDWNGEVNSCPRAQSRGLDAEIPIDIAVPVTPAEWSDLRTKS
jgi:hypothetical protein